VKVIFSMAALSTSFMGVSVSVWPDYARATVSNLMMFWWILPILASAFSIVGLCATAIISSHRGLPWLPAFSTRFYLAVGSSLISLNIVPIVPGTSSAPAWASPLLFAGTFLSAWGYYVASADREDTDLFEEPEPPLG
jgi:hypothetical protein